MDWSKLDLETIDTLLKLEDHQIQALANETGTPTSSLKRRLRELRENCLQVRPKATSAIAEFKKTLEKVLEQDSTQLSRQEDIFAQSKDRFAELNEKSGVLFWMGDIHFPHERPDALELAYILYQAIKPTVVTTGNDLGHFSTMSYWDNIVDKYTEFWEADIERLLGLFRTHHKVLTELSPESEKIFVTGNHDKLVFAHLRKQGGAFSEKNVADFVEAIYNQDVLIFSSHHKHEPVFQLGELRFTHGIGRGRPNSAASQVISALAENGQFYSTAQGHLHRQFQVDMYGVTHYNVGCLCDFNVEYATHAQRWDLGVGVFHYGAGRTHGELIKFHEVANRLEAYYHGQRYSVALQKRARSIIR